MALFQDLRENTNSRIPVESGVSNAKLNVFAKEFIMSSPSPLQASKSTGSILNAVEDSTKNAKSILHHMHKGSNQISHGHSPRAVQWMDEKLYLNNDNSKTVNSSANSLLAHRDLKRSKSTGSTIHSLAMSVNSFPQAQELALFDGHPAENAVKNACIDPAMCTCEEIIELPRQILEKALDDRAHAQSYATITMTIIEKECSGTFLESLLNICQFTCEKKKSQKSGEQGPKYQSFMAYLNELYSQMKPKQSQLKLFTGSSPTHTVLSLLVQVCQAVLSQKSLSSRPEVECLFFTVTTVGRDLELEDPRLLDALMWAVRDAFLAPGTSQPNKHTLLQLIELKAAKWHLPASTIMYYKNNAHI
ncbi:MIF4G domain-containing protein B isoform X2 [Rhodnius prolixus]|uniref:MIF4G domain-containing protein n=1 Tax=Rhodnius prolixus TaxID=13249 RepID=T1HWW9_RHOPR